MVYPRELIWVLDSDWQEIHSLNTNFSYSKRSFPSPDLPSDVSVMSSHSLKLLFILGLEVCCSKRGVCRWSHACWIREARSLLFIFNCDHLIFYRHATLGDHEHIQNCCRTLTDVYLVLEPCSMQELFLPTVSWSSSATQLRVFVYSLSSIHISAGG